MKMYGWLGLLLLVVAAFLMRQRVEPFYSWFYSFAWWSYILIADSLVLRIRGTSLLHDRRRELVRMLPLSVFMWLLFEGCNLVLKNWAYEGLPAEAWLRWPGYALAFATVFPGIFVTSDLLEAWLLRRRDAPAASEAESLTRGSQAFPSRALAWAGLALTAAVFVWPRYFFPAIWVGPIFLLDPLLETAGVNPLSRSIAPGRKHRIWSLLLGGLACGFLWEFWNFWAGSRWVYTVPFFGFWKLFEMPALGFLGFPPFALECWIIYHWLSALERKARWIFWPTVLIYSAWAMRQIDNHTVLRFAAVAREMMAL